MAKILIPPSPVAGGPLTVRFDGPFPAPAPVLSLRVEGNQVIARSSSADYVLPNEPAVAFVQATIAAPAAGAYVLVDERCDGLPPPPVPLCTRTVLQGFTVSQPPAIPALSGPAIAALLCLVALLGRQRIERAFTALERLRR